MRERKRNCGWRLVSGVTVVSVLACTMSAFAQGQRPNIQQLKMQGETLTTVNVNSSGGVAQGAVAAAIYRTTPCGFQSWIGGMPAWLDQQTHFNDGGGGVPLRSMSIPMCYDTCHRTCAAGTSCAAGTCDVLGLGNICDCLDAGEFPITASFQLWDGDPCAVGSMMIAGASGSLTIDESLIPLNEIGDGSSNCFSIDITVAPKVVVPHDTWVEAMYGADDGWPLSGRATISQGTSQFAGLNDGVDCTTFCDRGPDPILCVNDLDNCDYLQHNADSNAELFFSLRPVAAGGGQELVIAKGGIRVDFDVFVSDFDLQQIPPVTRIQAWQSEIDSSGYTSGAHGTLTPLTIPCVVGICAAPPVNVGNLCKGDADCDDVVLCSAPPANVGNVCTDDADCDTNLCTDPPANVGNVCTDDADCDTNPGDGDGVCESGDGLCDDNDGVCDTNQPGDQCFAANLGMGDGSPCNSLTSTCNAGFFDCSRADYLLACNAIGACNVTTLDYVCAAAFIFASESVPTTKADAYLWTVVLKVSPKAKGTFTIDLAQPPDNILLDSNANLLPLIGVIPALLTIETGQCCIPDAAGGPGDFICVTDDITANNCAGITGGRFDKDKTCADSCACASDADCLDDDACTVGDCCEPNEVDPVSGLCPTGVAEGVCAHTKVAIAADECCNDDPALGDDQTGGGAIANRDDGNQCTNDTCVLADGSDGGNRGTVLNTVKVGDSCDDGIPCEKVNDTCQADGTCVGEDILQIDCPDNAFCEALTQGLGSCNPVTGKCRCVPPSLNFDILASSKENPNCFPAGEKVTVNVVYEDVPVVVTGAQFAVLYDPSCLRFNSITPGGAPFVFEIDEIVDQAAGRIFYAVGVDPFGGQGLITTGVLATISFTKLDNGCGPCNLCFGDDKLLQTILVDDVGQTVQDVEPKCSKDILTNERLTLEGPSDVIINADCGEPTAVVSFDAATASSTCGVPTLECIGMHESGKLFDEACSGAGGLFPQGRTDCWCTATSDRCGKIAEHHWSVTVTDEQSFDLVVQLSPIIAGDLHRCIRFELFSDCVTPPITFKQEMWFGGVWDFIGHASPKKKLPKGQWVAMSAMDQNHTLRACADVVDKGSQCSATFKGDPFFGGNWLIGGNLDAFKVKLENPKASFDKINILDFGIFVSQFGAIVDPNSDCPGLTVHADINGDGVVDALDFAFIFNNFLAHAKDCVCPSGVSGGSDDIVPTDTEVSVAQLREWGMPELAVADLNGDGVVNMDDMSAFLAGETPTTKTRRGRTGSGLGSR